MLLTDTPIEHMWDRMWKMSGKNISPTKQYINGKNGTAIIIPVDLADKHAAGFTDNSSAAHHTATYQTFK